MDSTIITGGTINDSMDFFEHFNNHFCNSQRN